MVAELQQAKLHVTHITNLYAPSIGGLERNVASTCEELVRRGHRATVITMRLPGTPEEEMINGVRVVRLRGGLDLVTTLHADQNRPFLPTFVDPRVAMHLGRLLADDPPDVVHTHDWMVFSYFPVQRRDRRIPHVHTAHDYSLICPKKTLIYTGAGSGSSHCTGSSLHKCLRCAPAQYGRGKGVVLTVGRAISARHYKQIDKLLVLSHSMIEAVLMASAVSRSGPPEVVPSFVPDDVGYVARNTPKPAWLPHRYLLFVGALGRHKGLETLFEAYLSLRSRDSENTNGPALVCIGTPRADTPPIPEGVLIKPNVAHAEVMSAFHHAEAAIVPSLWAEPFGQVAVEAMLAGAPVVASAVGGLLDIVQNEVTGLLVRPGDAEALCSAIIRILGDPRLVTRLTHHAAVHAVAFTASRVVERIEQIYNDAIAAMR